MQAALVMIFFFDKVWKVLSFQRDIKAIIRDELEKDIKELLEPLDSLRNLGGGFLENLMTIFDTYQTIKDAYLELKTGYIIFS